MVATVTLSYSTSRLLHGSSAPIFASCATLVAIAMLAGCGGSGSSSSAAAPGAPTPPAPSAADDLGTRPALPAPEHTAELVLHGGDLHTMDAARPRASALAIRGGKLVAVGSDAEVMSWIGPSTKVIALEGRSVTPGLVDAHCHVSGLAADLERVSVRHHESEAAVAQTVAKAAAGRPAGEWVLGRGWDQNHWPGQKFPTKQSLDAVVADRPVVLERIDGHAMWLNSAALAKVGITAKTRDPAGGKIVRDGRGQPTGVLIDNATALVDRATPGPTPEARERALRRALALVSSLGLTGAHEMGIDEETAALYRKLAAAGELPLRIYAFRSAPADAAVLRDPPAPAVGRFVMRGVKFYADGALGSRGARLYADYSDEKKNRGLWVTEPAALTRGVKLAVGGGWQVAVHAIGDAGIGAVLDAFAAAERAHPPAQPGGLRLRIEHVQVIAPADLERMATSGVIASMQPTHATSDMPWAEARVGAQRILGAYAWRSMLDRKIPLAGGSDFPVEQPSPLLGIYSAVRRQSPEGEPAAGWYPAQRLSLDEAIAAFTSGAAYAEGAEAKRGVLAVGMEADLTVYGRELTDDKKLLTMPIAMTIVDGEIEYQSQR